MEILVCIKRYVLAGSEFVLTPDAMEIDAKNLGYTMAPHEEVAVEQAIRFVEQFGGSTTVLSLGVPEAEEQMREQMAIGADRGILLATDGGEWDPQATAGAIVDAVKAQPQAFDLILFGAEAADSNGSQVGIRVAHALGLPIVTNVRAVTISDSVARCERVVGNSREVYEVTLPAVMTTREGLNIPRYPSVPGRIKARKKPIETSTPAKPASKLEKLKLIVPPNQKTGATVLGHGAAAAPAAVAMMEEIGVLP
ncbi:MAG: electron transfer flavoprotein subunit beta/FixA family protein [Candidatus Nanopelagicales bacterium]